MGWGMLKALTAYPQAGGARRKGRVILDLGDPFVLDEKRSQGYESSAFGDTVGGIRDSGKIDFSLKSKIQF